MVCVLSLAVPSNDAPSPLVQKAFLTCVSIVKWVLFRFFESGLMTLAARITSPRT